MKSNKLTSLLCALALTGAVMPLSMAEAAEPALSAPAAAAARPPRAGRSTAPVAVPPTPRRALNKV